MKINKFDVVELNDGDKATILDINNKDYYVEIVNDKGMRVDIRNITENEISKVIFSK